MQKGDNPSFDPIARIEDLEAKVTELTNRLDNGDAADAQRFRDLEQQVQDLTNALRKIG
jgi:hypothetical protein